MNINQDEVIQCVYLTKKEILLDILAELFSVKEVNQLIYNKKYKDKRHKKYKRYKNDKNNKNNKRSLNLKPANCFENAQHDFSSVESPNIVQKKEDHIPVIQRLEPRLDPLMLFQYRGSVPYDPLFKTIGRSPYF